MDLVLSKGGETFLVRRKQWTAYKVGVEAARELYGVMAAKGAAGGSVVTSGQFTQPAREFARGRNLKLVDAQVLLRLLHQARTVRGEKTAAMMAPVIPAAADPHPAVMLWRGGKTRFRLRFQKSGECSSQLDQRRL